MSFKKALQILKGKRFRAKRRFVSLLREGHPLQIALEYAMKL